MEPLIEAQNPPIKWTGQVPALVYMISMNPLMKTCTCSINQSLLGLLLLLLQSTGEFMQKSLLVRSRRHGGTNFLGQCKTLTKRSFINMTRDLGYYWLRVVMYVMVGVCLGTIFWQVGQSYSSIMVSKSTHLCLLIEFLFFNFIHVIRSNSWGSLK